MWLPMNQFITEDTYFLSPNPNTTLMIGDAPMDYISAQNANIDKTILVATGQIDIETLALTSKHTIESLDKIIIY